ncbi:CPBP family intramembrane glutamic endopeptidase [Pseudanabaena sp. FACHB-2040]|uniref:CPBP family intramembrane glutamic endopeptidase n=1 Tax=Pseudanabaena sp. FACHB-2040 TaxID=2692859 RepID=UPI001683FAED|nr:CPBP family intramembrane glutamic endopeptidase [Pseudanabaena sp. FACHB-2040]MBD2261303.1 CPBP family intramembrane metalloprotease [Pseudanabaena sp. FACHB-2040]
MKINAIKGKQGIGTEVQDATYVEAARWGKHRGWRYVLGLVVIFFVGLVVGGIATPRIAFLFGGQEGLAAFSRLDYAAFGPVGGFVAVTAIFPFFLAGILIAVTLVHRRHPRTLITAQERISWRRVGHGFVAWFVPFCLIGGLGQYLFYPNTFSFNFDLATFALFVPLALVFTAIQTTTEELFFRGYIVQGASLVWTSRVFLALVPATIFALSHLLNPEASAGGWLTVFFNYFLVPGLVWTVVSLIDGTTELVIGAHFANNIGGVLLFNVAGSAVNAPALFTISKFHVTYAALSMLVVVSVFLAIAYKVFKRDKASEPVFQSDRIGRR